MAGLFLHTVLLCRTAFDYDGHIIFAVFWLAFVPIFVCCTLVFAF